MLCIDPMLSSTDQTLSITNHLSFSTHQIPWYTNHTLSHMTRTSPTLCLITLALKCLQSEDILNRLDFTR